MMASLISEIQNKTKLSHKKWKALQKKEKRRLKRREEAISRDEAAMKVLELKELSPSHQTLVHTQEQREQQKKEEEEKERARQHRVWLVREAQAQREFKWKKEQEQKEKIRKEEEEKRIKEEWEERQRKETEETEKREKKKQEQEKLLKEATANENKKEDGPWHNPIAPTLLPGKERHVEKCPFFAKTGACRFGERCSRLHEHPETSCTLLIPGMYAHFSLEQSLRDEYDTDINLEYEETEMYKHFENFYNDVLPEFKAIGKVFQFKVCCNFEPHLRGNVYVQFQSENEAYAAFGKFNARWYGGRQLNCEFTNVTNWKSAICGLYNSKRCPKGKSCNFLHCFKNPGNEFWEANRDSFLERQHRNCDRQGHSYRRSRSRDRSRRRSRERSHRSRSRERSSRRSRERSYRRSRSHRSRSREKLYRSRSSDRHEEHSSTRKRSESLSSRSSDESQSKTNNARKHKQHKKHKKHKRKKEKNKEGIADKTNNHKENVDKIDNEKTSQEINPESLSNQMSDTCM